MTGQLPAAPTEPAKTGLSLIHEHDRSIWVLNGSQPLLRYVYRPWDAQRESPRPYFHPLRTLGGDVVSLYRPHDHVWHKGIAWSLPNVGTANFWGGGASRQGRGLEQLPNDGAMRHRRFTRIEATPAAVTVAHELDWVTAQGETWFAEARCFAVTLTEDAWALSFATEFVNVTDGEVVIGSPTTEGRENAGYGGLFWRGPRSFTGGRVYAPGIIGGDELMGIRAPWMGFCGRHDGHDGSSTIVMVDGPGNGLLPTQWFVRSEPFACLCPAPFFSEKVPVAPGAGISLRYAAVIADGERGSDGTARLAEAGLAALQELIPPRLGDLAR